MHGESAFEGAIHRAHTYGGQNLELITVKLANRNAGVDLKQTLHWNDGAYYAKRAKAVKHENHLANTLT